MKKQSASILIVDDTADNLRLLASMLTKHGFKVRNANDGLRAITSIKLSIPDLILLDVLMPGLNGYEVCSRLKANPETAEIPIIFISALDGAFDKVKAFEVGGVDYITKPFNPHSARQIVVSYVLRKRSFCATNVVRSQEKI